MSDFVTPKYRQSTYCEVAEGFNGAYVNFDEVVILKLDHQSFRLEPLYDDDADEPEKDRMLLFQADQVNIALRRIHEKAVAERDALKEIVLEFNRFVPALSKENDALKAENERLRDGLKRMREECFDDSEWAQIIDKALQGGE